MKNHSFFNRLLKIIIVIAIVIVIIKISIAKLSNPSNHNLEINKKIFKEFEAMPLSGNSIYIEDITNSILLFSKNETKKIQPASLAKLFVASYASSICKLTDNLIVTPEALALVKPESSLAYLKLKKYNLKDLLAAMLVPSGNDASYVVAEHIGKLLNPQSKNIKESLEAFQAGLYKFLQNKGYKDTNIVDPSGYDNISTSSCYDISKVTIDLLKNKWFRDIVSSHKYTATLSDSSTQEWKNTNELIDKSSHNYYEGVIGVKTGSLENNYNLVVLYKIKNREYILCSINNKEKQSRYDDIINIINKINNGKL